MGLIYTGWRGLATRFLLSRKARAFLTAAAVALGAALLSAVLTLGATLEAAVINQMREQFGTYDVMVGAPDVTTDVIASHMAAEVETMPGVAYTVPLLTRPVGKENTPVRFYSGVGRFPPGEQGARVTEGRLPESGEVVLSSAVAERLAISLGGIITLPFPDGERSLRLVGLFSSTGQPSMALFSFDWLREELHLNGPSVLLVGLRPGTSKQSFAANVQGRYPSLNLDLRSHVDEWRNNLGGVGLVGRLLGIGALITSCFLVLGSFGIALQERTRELAVLRAVGAGRNQVVRLMLTEGLLIGTAGATGGLVLGLVVAAGLIRVVSVRMGVPGHTLVIPGAGLACVWAATTLLALAGAWPAARRAGGTPPLAAMRPDGLAEERQSRWGRWIAMVLLLLAGAAIGFSYRPELEMPQRFMVSTLAAAFLFLATLAALPPLLLMLTRLLAAVLGRWFPVQATVGQRNLERQRGRAARTAGVLVLGLASLISVTALLTTDSVSRDEGMRAMFPTGAQISGPWGSPMGYDDNLVSKLRALHGVDDVIPLGLEVGADLVGYDAGRANPTWVQQVRRNRQAPEHVWLQPVDHGELGRIYPYGSVEGQLNGGVVLTRQLAADMGLNLGERIQVRLAGQGTQHSLTITGLVDHLPAPMVFAVDQEVARRDIGLAPIYRTTLIALSSDADRSGTKRAVQGLLGARYAAFTYEDLSDLLAQGRQRQREILVMVTVATLILLTITAVGIVNTVTALMRERQRELAVVRAVGASPGETAWLTITEMLLTGMAGSLMGVGLGVLVSIVMWLHGIQAGQGVALPWVLILLGLLCGPVLTAAAVWAPVRRVLQTTPSQALRTE